MPITSSGSPGALSRRDWLRWSALSAASVLAAGCAAGPQPAMGPDPRIADEAFAFVTRCERPDGGYAPSADPAYPGNSDTRASDLAAVTYAAVLAKTLGRELLRPDLSAAFIRRHQRPDGVFVNLEGSFKSEDDLAVLYNTTQGVVSLRALGERPSHDPASSHGQSTPTSPRSGSRELAPARPYQSSGSAPGTPDAASLARPAAASRRRCSIRSSKCARLATVSFWMPCSPGSRSTRSRAGRWLGAAGYPPKLFHGNSSRRSIDR